MSAVAKHFGKMFKIFNKLAISRKEAAVTKQVNHVHELIHLTEHNVSTW